MIEDERLALVMAENILEISMLLNDTIKLAENSETASKEERDGVRSFVSKVRALIDSEMLADILTRNPSLDQVRQYDQAPTMDSTSGKPAKYLTFQHKPTAIMVCQALNNAAGLIERANAVYRHRIEPTESEKLLFAIRTVDASSPVASTLLDVYVEHQDILFGRAAGQDWEWIKRQRVLGDSE